MSTSENKNDDDDDDDAAAVLSVVGPPMPVNGMTPPTIPTIPLHGGCSLNWTISSLLKPTSSPNKYACSEIQIEREASSSSSMSTMAEVRGKFPKRLISI